VFLVDRDPRLRLLAVGAGPPVVLVSGWSASWEVWEPTVGELSRPASVHRPRHPRHGLLRRGGGPDYPATVRTFV